MARLLELPNELLLNIVQYLISDAKSLQSLCRTSKSFLAVAQPALYTSVEITEPAGDPLRYLKSFLAAVLRHQPLAKATKELYLVNDLSVRYEWPALGHDTRFMEISSLIGCHPFEIEPELCYYPLAVEVLSRLPNLQHLHLTTQIEHPGTLLHRLHELQAATTILQNLKTFHLQKEYEDGMVNIDDYIQFLRYPSFEKLTTNWPGHKVLGYPPINTLSHSVVELYWSIVNLPILEHLLHACSCINMFCFVLPATWRYECTWDVGHLAVVAPRDLLKALLASHAKTLHTLHLDFHYYYTFASRHLRQELAEEGVNLSDSDYTYLSFRGFENLMYMTIEFEKLNNARDLPEALKGLNLEFCRFAEFEKDALHDLVHVQKWCPKIEYITISGQEMTNEGIKMVVEHARTLEPPVPFQVTSNGSSGIDRVLTFSGIGRHLQIQSHEPMFPDESDESDESGEDGFDDEDEESDGNGDELEGNGGGVD